MKKFLAILLCSSFIYLPVYSAITDEYVNLTLDKNLKIKSSQKVEISDTFVEQTLDKNLKIKPVFYKPPEDIFAENNKNKNILSGKVVDYKEFFPAAPVQKYVKKIVIFDNLKAQKIVVKPQKRITTRTKIDEGDYIKFTTVYPFILNGKEYPAGTIVNARVETISKNKSWGVPADLIIGNFSIDEIPLGGEISKVGANRTLWVRPMVISLSLLFFGTGILLIPIRGGHAKINKWQKYTLYAE